MRGGLLQILVDVHTEKYFPNLIESTRNQIVFTIFDWFGTKRTSDWFQTNRKMINTIWFRVDSIRFGKYFSVCTAGNISKLNRSPVRESRNHIILPTKYYTHWLLFLKNDMFKLRHCNPSKLTHFYKYFWKNFAKS